MVIRRIKKIFISLLFFLDLETSMAKTIWIRCYWFIKEKNRIKCEVGIVYAFQSCRLNCKVFLYRNQMSSMCFSVAVGYSGWLSCNETLMKM